MTRSRWPSHDYIVAFLQVSDEMVRHELHHQVVAAAEPAAAVTLERKAQRETKLVRIGGSQIPGVIGHAGRLDQTVEQIKNTMSEASCLTAIQSGTLTTWQTVRFPPSRHLSAEFSASQPTGPTRYTSSPKPSAWPAQSA